MLRRQTGLFIILALLGLVLRVAPATAQGTVDDRLVLASPEAIQADAALQARVQTLAQTAIADHCATCHGPDLAGAVGVPNLVDFDWNWGVTGFELTQAEAVFEIMQTILYGIRSDACPEDFKRYGGCPDTRFSQMPGYQDLQLSEAQIDGLVDYVFALAGRDHDPAAVANVAGLTSLCAECHGEDGSGYKAFGGPDLTDDVWLYGDGREQVHDVIAHGRTGQCPAWWQTLDMATIKALAVTLFNRSMGY